MDRVTGLVGLLFLLILLAFAHQALLAWLSSKRLDIEGRQWPIAGRSWSSIWTDHDRSNYAPEVQAWIWPLRILFALQFLVLGAIVWTW